ncbi:hypothetical protein RUMHYD_03163 [Blautia hydrogenotrophica DSM 10507]|uniref:Uncharacterized protein n=1 Tax=Blautia hydrogenotrophica (strain DSM 10507 / JCM 14656 / S5a33) TaxID=476272 RepID=C0CQK0_BLAHS|nr:hypothetical protein RUMHYD_03163 [Blautia hydrogenotrophica DSM 10507]
MDWTGRRTVITGMNGDDKPQLTGAGDDTFVSDVVNQCLLIVGVEFNTFKAQLLYGIELAHVIRGIRVDACKGEQARSLCVLKAFVYFQSELSDAAELFWFCDNGQYYGEIYVGSSHGFYKSIYRAVHAGVLADDMCQVRNHSWS